MFIAITKTVGDTQIVKRIEVDEKSLPAGPADFLRTVLPLLIAECEDDAAIAAVAAQMDDVTQRATAAHAAVVAAAQES